MRGINNILNTGGLFLKSIPIGAITVLVRVMTRIFTISIIAARAKAGREASRGAPSTDPNPGDLDQALVK
jgi:hypothetical protein